MMPLAYLLSVVDEKSLRADYTQSEHSPRIEDGGRRDRCGDRHSSVGMAAFWNCGPGPGGARHVLCPTDQEPWGAARCSDRVWIAGEFRFCSVRQYPDVGFVPAFAP